MTVAVGTYIVTDTFVPTYVNVPLYYTSQTHVVLQLVDSQTAASKRFLNDATIIGIVCGGAAILAILVGGIIFIVKKSGKSITVQSASDQLEMATVVATPPTVLDMDTTDGLSLTSGGDPGGNFASVNPDEFTTDPSEGHGHSVDLENDGDMWV